jgi:sulfofructose kinase
MSHHHWHGGLDTSGAGDVFHGAYIASYLARPADPWSEHFLFARAASAWKIQHLGNEAGLPSVDNIIQMRDRYETPDAKLQTRRG